MSWSKVSFINHMNAWKDGRDPAAVVNTDGSRGLAWRGEVSAHVFETASVNAAQALANWAASRSGARAGKAAGFPRFKSRHRTRPAFRLRARYREGGVKTLAVVAGEHGRVLATVEGVKALRHAQARLKLANQRYSRTKRDSAGRRKAARRLGRVHARVAALRQALLHQLTTDIATNYPTVVIEDLNAAGMLANRRLARVVSDAAFGELRRQLEYKTAWYGTELVVADRWFPSSKTCSGCGAVKADLTLGDRTYDCSGCGLMIDRDVNAAANLARYTPIRNPSRTTVSPPLVDA